MRRGNEEGGGGGGGKILPNPPPYQFRPLYTMPMNPFFIIKSLPLKVTKTLEIALQNDEYDVADIYTALDDVL